MAREVRVQLPQLRGDLGDGDPDRSHVRSIRERPGRGGRREARPTPHGGTADARLPDAPGVRVWAATAGDPTLSQQEPVRALARPGTRSSGALVRALVVALCVAACGTTVQPSATVRPTVSAPSATPVLTDPPFAATSYPAADDAPCDQAEAPDASHAAYTGNLKRITATDPTTVTFELCRPDVAFLPKVAAPAFAINDTAWLEAHARDGQGGEASIVSEVNGTGPYRSEGWHRGSEISLARNDEYWGTRARNERLIVRWRDPAAARLVELQNATVDGIDDLDPTAIHAVEEDVEPAAGATRRLERRLPRLHRHLRAVRHQAGPPGHRHGHRPAASRLDRLPARFGGRDPLHPLCHPTRLRRRPLVRVRSAPGQGPPGHGRLCGRLRHLDPLSGHAQPGGARSDRGRPGAQGAAPHEPRDPGRARGRTRGHLSWPISPPASWMASTCPARP